MIDPTSDTLAADLADLLEVCRATVHHVDQLLDRSNFLITSLTNDQLRRASLYVSLQSSTEATCAVPPG